MCTPRSGHFVVVFFLDNASVALLSVPPTTQTLKQSTAPGTGDSKKPKACNAAMDESNSALVEAQEDSPPSSNS